MATNISPPEDALAIEERNMETRIPGSVPLWQVARAKDSWLSLLLTLWFWPMLHTHTYTRPKLVGAQENTCHNVVPTGCVSRNEWVSLFSPPSNDSDGTSSLASTVGGGKSWCKNVWEAFGASWKKEVVKNSSYEMLRFFFFIFMWNLMSFQIAFTHFQTSSCSETASHPELLTTKLR